MAKTFPTGLAEKTTVIDADALLVADSEAGNESKRLDVGVLKQAALDAMVAYMHAAAITTVSVSTMYGVSASAGKQYGRLTAGQLSLSDDGSYRSVEINPSGIVFTPDMLEPSQTVTLTPADIVALKNLLNT